MDPFDPEPLGDLKPLATEKVRRLRAEAVEVETSVSFARRMTQGRLDIVDAELRRRESGGPPPETGELIAHLPEILGEHGRAPGMGRLPQAMAPDGGDRRLIVRLDAVLGVGQLGDLPEVPDDELDRVADELRALEREISDLRRQLFDRIDALQAELTRRYRTGEASVESLLR